MTLNVRRDTAHTASLAAGWYDNGPRNVSELLMLIQTKIAEAINDIVAGRTDETPDASGKPCGLPTECADVVIRVLDAAGYLNVDLEVRDFELPFDAHAFAGWTIDMETRWLHTASMCLAHACEQLRRSNPIDDALRWVIHCMVLVAKRFGFDLWQAVDRKMAYNATRPMRHGKAF